MKATECHRPLVAGIAIKAGRQPRGTGTTVYRNSEDGTLTGLATRNSDNQKVLVSCKHVILADNPPSSGELPAEMYQGLLLEAHKVGGLAVSPPAEKDADIVYCPLLDGVSANFTLHDHPVHGVREIIKGVLEPVRQDDNGNIVEYVMLGKNSGEMTITVTEEVAEITTRGITHRRAARFTPPAQGGDSGGAGAEGGFTWQVQDGRRRYLIKERR